MNEVRRQARVAGWLYLLQAFTAPINLMYVVPKMMVRGDAAATTANIMASEGLFRIGIAAELTAQAVAPFILWALYRLLKDVHPMQAMLMLILGLASVSTTFLNVLNQIAALFVLKNGELLAGFSQPQIESLSYLFLRLHGQGVQAVSIFWGLWLFPFGYLVYRSRFIPKIFGVLLIINGFAYLVASAIFFLLPEYRFISEYMLIPEAVGEPAIILWLVIRGTRRTSDE